VKSIAKSWHNVLVGWLVGWLAAWLVGWLVGWLFNGTSTQKGQFVPNAGRENSSVG